MSTPTPDFPLGLLSPVDRIFPKLTPEQVERVAAHGHPRTVHRGEILVSAGQEAQSRAAPVLVAFLEQELHPEADAEHWSTAPDGLPQRAPERLRPLHPQPERRDAREDDALGALESARVLDEVGVAAGAPERLQDRAQIAQSEIDDGRAHRTPLVLGTAPAIRSSTATA